MAQTEEENIIRQAKREGRDVFMGLIKDRKDPVAKV